MSVDDREGKDEYAKRGRVANVGEREQAEQHGEVGLLQCSE